MKLYNKNGRITCNTTTCTCILFADKDLQVSIIGELDEAKAIKSSGKVIGKFRFGFLIIFHNIEHITNLIMID